MIPVDTSCEPGPRDVDREYCNRGRGVDTASGRHTFFPSPNKATTMLSSPRRSTRLAGNIKSVKRNRRSLKLPTGRMLRMEERSRMLLPGEETSMSVGTARSELRSNEVVAMESDDAVVPRCSSSSSILGKRHHDETTSGAPPSSASVSSVIISSSSSPMVVAAPKDAKRPCFHQHHLPQQEHLNCHPHHHQHQQQQQPHLRLSSGCQMSSSHPSSSSSSLSSSSSSSSLSSSSSSVETLVGRVPMASPRLINIPIHDDPRQWSRLDVRTWLDHVRRVYNIRDLDLDRFPMNGKALCIMSKDMFVYRVPHGGVPLYIDFQLRFRRALSNR